MGCVGDYITGRVVDMSTGGNYITAAQAQQMQLEQEKLRYAQQQVQLQNQYAQAQNMGALQNSYHQTVAGGGTQTVFTQQAQPVNFRQTLGSTPKGLTPTFEQLDDPDSPFNLSLEALAVMWGARFGYRWVRDEDTADAIEENQEMWSVVSSRLLEAGMLVHQNYRHPDMLGTGVAWKLFEKDHGNN